MSKEFKPLKPEDFKLTPEEEKILVRGAQKFFPPEPDTDTAPPAEKETHANQS